MDFTIVTPSYRQLDWLELCIASVADQEGVSVEHIVQDGGTEGFANLAKKMAERWPDRPGYRRIMISEKDNGMYDAINRGLAKARGLLCGYLNCDEQYLPGTLKKVAERFQESPEIDLFLGNVIVVDSQGEPVCLRKMVTPGLSHTWTCHFSGLTAGIFFRKKLLDRNLFFNTTYRIAADAEWFVRILCAGIQVQPLGITTSTFMDAGDNLGFSPAAIAERIRLTQSAPTWMRALRPWWVLWHRVRRLVAGAHRRREVSYEILLPGQDKRRRFARKTLRTTWPKRMWGF